MNLDPTPILLKIPGSAHGTFTLNSSDATIFNVNFTIFTVYQPLNFKPNLIAAHVLFVKIDRKHMNIQ